MKISAFSAKTQRMAHNKPDFFSTVLGYAQADPEFNKMKPMDKIKYLDGIVEKQTTGGLNDNTLRTKALDITSKYFEAGGAGHSKYKALLKSDPAAAEKMYNDYFNQQLGLAKSTLGAAPTGNVVDFNSLP